MKRRDTYLLTTILSIAGFPSLAAAAEPAGEANGCGLCSTVSGRRASWRIRCLRPRSAATSGTTGYRRCGPRTSSGGGTPGRACSTSWRRSTPRLDASDRINADIFRRQLEDRVLEHRFGGYRLPINADSGFHTDLARLPQEVPLATSADYDALHRPADCPAALLRRTDPPDARGAGHRHDRAQGHPRGLRGDHRRPRRRRGREERLLGTVRQTAIHRSGERAPAPAPGGFRRRARRRHRRLSHLSAVLSGRVPAGRANHPGRFGVAGGPRLLPLSDPPLHHPRPEPGGDPPHRPGGGRADSRRDGGGDRRGRLRRRVSGVPRPPAHRPEVLRDDARGASQGSRLDRQAHGRQAAGAVQDAAAPALRRRAGARPSGAQIHHRPLRRRPAGQHPAGALLGQHLRSRRADRCTTWRR